MWLCGFIPVLHFIGIHFFADCYSPSLFITTLQACEVGGWGRKGGGAGREDTGAGACSLRVGVGPGGAGSRGFGRRGGDICGEPWGPNQASDWQGEQTALTLTAPHCPTLPQEWLGAGLLSAVLWATGASGQEPRCAWDLLPCFLLPSLAASTCSPCLPVCTSLCPQVTAGLRHPGEQHNLPLSLPPARWKPEPSLTPAPRPRRLCVLGQPPLSSLRSPLPSSGPVLNLIRASSDHCPPPPAPPQPLLLPPHPSVSPKPSSLCPPICRRQPWAHSPWPRPPARPLSPQAQLPRRLQGSFPLSAQRGLPTATCPSLLFSFPRYPFSSVVPSFPPVSLAPPQLMGEGGDSGVPAPSP